VSTLVGPHRRQHFKVPLQMVYPPPEAVEVSLKLCDGL